jgi:menaquinone-9 beta-reductase
MTSRFDCIIVGARCAGAALATHLARAGQKVLVLDAQKMPSDQPFSTHAIQPKGLDYLDELGVAEGVRRRTPQVKHARMVVNGHPLDIPLQGRDMRCPRRLTLDPLLQEAAASSGAELRDASTVVDLVRERDRVVGVRVRRGKTTEELRAPWVVGADGRHSLVARKVAASEYHVTEAARGGYWNYWRAPRRWHEDARWPFQTAILIDGQEARFAFETDDDHLIIGALAPPSEVKRWAPAPQDALERALARHPLTGPLIEEQSPVGRPVGLIKARFFFRQAAGAGWALVGDAGLHKDPTPGLGITDALRDAKSLARAILDGRDVALERYWRQRDVDSVPLYFNASDMGALEYANPFTELVYQRANAAPEIKQRMRAVFDRELSPYDMIPAGSVVTWTLGALLRGRFEILPHFIRGARRRAALDREMALRRELLERAESRAGASGGA